MSVKKFDTEFLEGCWYLVNRTPLGAGGLPRGALTEREERILEHICLLKQNKEIANALNISLRTVKFHVTNILRKCDCRSRAELIYKHRCE